MKKIFFILFAALLANASFALDNLYMIGTASPAGWKVENATPMTKLSDGTFEYTGWMNENTELKFLSAQSSWDNAFGPAHNEYSEVVGTESFNELVNNVVYDLQKFNDGQAHDYGDYKFKIKTAGTYTVHVDIESMKVSSWPVFVYPVGDGCSVGWDTTGVKKFQETAFASGIYIGDMTLKGSGEMKYICQKDWGRMFGRKTQTDGISKTGTYYCAFEQSASNDRKWSMSIAEKKYHLVLDVKNEQLRVLNYISGPVTLEANKTEISIGENVVLTPTLTDYDGQVTYTYYVNGVEKELVNNTFTPSEIGSYTIKVVATAEEQSFTSNEVSITVNSKDITIKLHPVNAVKDAFGSIYLYYWAYYDGYDHAKVTTLTDEQDGWLSATVTAKAPVKFLFKNKNSTSEWGTHQSANKTNSEKGFVDDVCVEMDGSLNGDSKYTVTTLSDCQILTYDMSLSADKSELMLGESVVLTPTIQYYTGTPAYTYYVNDVETAIVNNTFTPSAIGEYTITCKATPNTKECSASVKVKAKKTLTFKVRQTVESAASDFGTTIYFRHWENYDGYDHASIVQMTKEGDWFTAQVTTAYPVKFLLKNTAGVDDWSGKRSVDMNNEGQGYLEDVCVELQSRKNDSQYYRAYELSGCTYSANQFTINAYVDEALKNDINSYQKSETEWIPSKWDKVSFYTYGDDHMQYNDYWVSDITASADGWYSYNYQNVDEVTLVIAGCTSWTGNPYRQAQDIKNISASKYYYVTNGSNGQTNRVAIELAQKVTPITFTFRFSDQAKPTWGGKDVYLRYWMNYHEPGEEAARDHVFFKQLTADDNGIYSCTIFPIAPIKLTIQSCGEGYHGEKCEDGHWTNDLSGGYTTNQDFIIKDYNAGGHLLEEYSADQLNVHFTSDGYATACWDRTWTIEGADVYMGEYDATETALYLNIVNDGIVPANAGVVLYSTSKADQVVPLVATANKPQDYNAEQNHLLGTTVSTALPQTGTTFVLAKTTKESATMLYQYEGATIPANKAYLNIPSSGAPARVRMITRTTPTALTTIQNKDTAQKIMRNNQIYILKNGKVYSVIGQIVK